MLKFTVKDGGLADRCAVKPVIWEACNELVQAGHASSWDFVLPVSASDEVYYAESEAGDVIGVLCVAAGTGQTRKVSLFYVEPSSRRLGVFRALWEKAQKAFKQPLVVTIHASNEAACLALEGLNLRPVAATYGSRR